MYKWANINNRRNKIASILIACVFCLSDISFALSDFTITENLSPPIRVKTHEFADSYAVAAICRAIEQYVSLDNTQAIEDIYTWVKKAPNADIQITKGPFEVIIDIPREGVSIRYFDPTSANVVTPYSDVIKLETKVLSVWLNRQIIHRAKALDFGSSETIGVPTDHTGEKLNESQGKVKNPIKQLHKRSSVIVREEGEHCEFHFIVKDRWYRRVIPKRIIDTKANKSYIDSKDDLDSRFAVIKKLSGKSEGEIASKVETYTSSIPLNRLTMTHKDVRNPWTVLDIISHGAEVFREQIEQYRPVVYKWNDTYFISEGNHRSLAAYLLGEKSITANVVEIKDVEGLRNFVDHLEKYVVKKGTPDLGDGADWFLEWLTSIEEGTLYCAVEDYMFRNELIYKKFSRHKEKEILLRVPLEVLEYIGKDNACTFCLSLQKTPGFHVELYYMSGVGKVSEEVYVGYGLEKRSLSEDFRMTRENTVTLFSSLKGEDVDRLDILLRLGSMDVSPENTILSPVGLQNDPAGLIRATILGLKMMDLARQIKEKGRDITRDQAFKDKIQMEILEQLKNICDPEDFENFDLTPDDIIDLATGNINRILPALKKLIRLLPITPLDTQEVHRIYERFREVVTAA